MDELQPGQEPLTPEEKERFLARVRGEGRTLTSAEMYAIFGPPPEPVSPAPVYADVPAMPDTALDAGHMAQLQVNFFPELGGGEALPALQLLRGIIFDFDHTLAMPTRPLAESMAAGAQGAVAYMTASGMTLPPDFATQVVEARLFAEEKSAEEKEEHLADDALSFLLQFYGYPTSRLDPDVLHKAVDIFYAPEMTAWRLTPGVEAMLATLQAAGYKLALLTNYNCDRVFQRTVDYLRLRPFFDVVLSSASVEYRKPDPRYLQIVLDRWDALPYEVVVVGDSLIQDIQAGIDLGALTVLVQGETSPQVAHDNAQAAGQIQPDAVISAWGQLPDVIAAWV
jgi:HAD superfamily hydrolase (TIGR01509 family)